MSNVATRAENPMTEFYSQLASRSGEFAKALPAHIKPDHFQRAAVTAVTQNPKLLDVDRRSLINCLFQCAQDGLIPDGREAVITIFKSRERGPIAGYMPMIAGIRKKVQQGGEITRFEQFIVHQNDEFEFQLGDTPRIHHRPVLSERGQPVLVYSVAQFRDGTLSREVMTVEEIEYTRRTASRSADDGPWRYWWSEMARKTVARRHAKILPMSTDVAAVINRSIAGLDDAPGALGPSEMPYVMASDPAPIAAPPRLAAALENLATDGKRPPGRPRGSRTKPAPQAGPSVAVHTAAPGHDPETGEIIETSAPDYPRQPPADRSPAAPLDPSRDPDGFYDSAAGGQPIGDVAPGSTEAGPAPEDAAGDGSAPAAESGPQQPNFRNADAERGWKDAKSGAKTCLNAGIRNDPVRYDHWKAGYMAFIDQQGQPREVRT